MRGSQGTRQRRRAKEGDRAGQSPARRTDLGILGGSFNPPHLGHLAIAERVRKAHALDRVLFLPAGSPPHKQEDLAPAADRLEMVRLAVAGREGLEASDLELRRAGTTYTVDTLASLRRLHPGAELFFIMGADSLRDLPLWREPERILELARVVVVNRPGVEFEVRAADFPGVAPEVLKRLEEDRVEIEPSPLESKKIRARVRAGKSIAGQVPPAVAAYIERRGLYRG